MKPFTRILKQLYILLFMCLLCMQGNANNIIGGNLELRAVSNTVLRYKVILRLQIDETKEAFSVQEFTVRIVQKKDGREMQAFKLARTLTKHMISEKTSCVGSEVIKVLYNEYEVEATLHPPTFSDPEGYYLVFEDCCRSDNLKNIANPEKASFVLRTYFPPVMKLGLPFLNSIPTLSEFNENYICNKEPFHFQVVGNDKDGDELRYSLESPLGYNSINRDALQWKNGYSENNAIPGSPSLAIDSKTGEVSVTPGEVGLFAFVVSVKEFRNGELIGFVNREYQLNVVECSASQIEEPTIFLDDQPVVSASACDGRTIQLTSKMVGDWNYQWRRDSKDIEGANNDTLQISENGDYELAIYSKGTCPVNAKSKKVRVNFSKSTLKLRTNRSGNICHSGESVTIYASLGEDYYYKWFQDERLLPNTADSLTTSKSGNYRVVLTGTNGQCKIASDTISVKVSSLTSIDISSKTGSTICSGDSISIIATTGPGYKYIWYEGNQQLADKESVLVAYKAGEYKVEVEDEMGCKRESNSITIKYVDESIIKLDSIAPICGVNSPPIQLKGTPAGGTFSGQGVIGNFFVPKSAGIGTHLIYYNLKNSGSCPGAMVEQFVVVNDVPVIDMDSIVTMAKGSHTYIGPNPSFNLLYQWSPPDDLENDAISKPVASPPDETVYTLTVTDASGCSATKHVQVKIKEHILIPDAFTPNNDGINETWELMGINSYPESEVSIFNRWGKVVFYSKGYQKPFDGSSDGFFLGSGVYFYKIKLTEQAPILEGSLMLIR